MTIKTIPDDFDPIVYNQKAPHPLQAWEWGEARAKMGIDVLRVGEFEEETLQNVFQITFHKIPYTHFKIGYLPRSVFPSEEILRFLYDYGKKNNVIFIKVEPYIELGTLGVNTHSLLVWVWVSSSHPLFPKWTLLLDLTKSEDELLKDMHPKTRYNIRLAEKKGVIVKEMTNDQGFATFSKLYFATCRRQKYFGHDLKYHKTIFETLKNKIVHILIAFYRDIPLAAYEVFIFNDVLYYPYGGSSEQHRNLMSNNLLMWEVIRFGRKMGCQTFDMWGALPPDSKPNHPWAGFTRFKQGFGGHLVELAGSYDLVIKKPLYGIYSIADTIRKLILKSTL